MTKVKKKKKIFRTVMSLLFSLLLLAGVFLVGYTMYLYKGIDLVYRVMGFAISIYLFLFLSYLLLRSIKKKGVMSFLIPFILTLIVIAIEGAAFYYLTKVYKQIDDLSNTNTNMKYTSLVSYNKELKSEKDLVNKKIGIVNDKTDIEGNVLPLEVIEELGLKKNNTIVEYDSTLELLYAVKNNKVDAGFFSSNYVDMFYSIEGYETIEEDTVVLYEKSKEYENTEEDIKSEGASLNKPFSMLLIGVDSSKDGVTSGYNADVLLLVTFNPKTLRATLTSVPRDMYLKTACSNGAYRRINTTTWGSSSSCAVQTIERLFDVDIDYYAKVNFKGVVKLVNAVGGIDVDVPYSFCEQNSSRKWGKNTVYVDKGQQHLTGEQALALARNRKTNKHCPKLNGGNRSDYTRGKNQMKVILGIVKAGTKITDPNKVVSVLDTVKSNLQTNIKSKDLLSLYNLAKSIVVSDGTNLINVQRMQLSGYGVYGKVYDPSSKSYPAVTIPYNGSINDIKKEIKANLKNSKISAVKKTSFDLNKEYKDTVIGQGSYSQARIATLANVSGYSVSKIKNYASSNGLKLKFIDKATGQTVNISDWSEYTFSSQKEHKDTILEQVSTLTIYVKKKVVQQQQTEEPTNPSEPTEQGGQ
ncbi:MAG: LCP family protein [Bacilli bacterium]|nr:LCP family protein [Bacilli bacterium]